MMGTRSIGRTGVRVSEIGFGAASIGNLYRAIEDDVAGAAVDAAWDGGIRYFDTAPHYGLGLSERGLGRALADRPRHEFVVSTKVGRLLAPNPTPRERDTDGFAVPGDLYRVWDFTRDGVRRSLDSSLQRLGLDRIDIVYAHDPDQYASGAAREALIALAELRAEGVVTAIGVGTNSAEQLTELLDAGLMDVAMLAGRYTVLEQDAVNTALEPAARAAGSIIAAAVFNSGLLSNPRPLPATRYDYAEPPIALVQRASRIADICEHHGVELPDAAIAFPLRQGVVSSVVLGMRTPAQVSQNLARYRTTIPDAVWTDLAAVGLVRPEMVGPEMVGREMVSPSDNPVPGRHP